MVFAPFRPVDAHRGFVVHATRGPSSLPQPTHPCWVEVEVFAEAFEKPTQIARRTQTCWTGPRTSLHMKENAVTLTGVTLPRHSVVGSLRSLHEVRLLN